MIAIKVIGLLLVIAIMVYALTRGSGPDAPA